MLVLTACSNMPFSRTSSQNKNKNYYTGNDGVVMRFSDMNTPPSRLYYFDGYASEDNQFQVMVDVHNSGASVTSGALFVSGYDPYMIRFRDVVIGRTGGLNGCTVSHNGNLLSVNDCFGTSGSFGNGGYDIRGPLSIVRDALGLGESQWDNVIIDASSNGDRHSYSANFGELYSADMYNHGNALLLVTSNAALTQYNGLNYQGQIAGPGLLEGDTPDYPGGARNTLTFDGIIQNWPRGLDATTKPITFLVTNCFFYTTYATPQVCIDPAPFDQGVKVCQPRAVNYNGGNGAPVAITSIEQENTPRKVLFEINIANVGGGTVMNMFSMNSCSPYSPHRLTTQDTNVVHLIDARIGGQHLKCTPRRWTPIHLINGRGSARCEYDMEYGTAKSAYETPLIVEVGYGYSITMRKSTTIKRVV